MNSINKLDYLKKLTDEMKNAIVVEDENYTTFPIYTNPTPEQAQEMYTNGRALWNVGGPAMAKTVEVDVKSAETGSTVKTRIYYPIVSEKLPILFYIHGGGFNLGSIDTHDRIMRILAEQTQSAVIGIDYTLSPEAKFPQALLECVASVQFYNQNAKQYDLDFNNIGFAGDSAGASLCMGTMLWLRDHGEDVSCIRALLLYYGWYGLSNSASMTLYGNAWDAMRQEDLDSYLQIYMEKVEDRENPYFNIYNNDLTKDMPATYIMACECDPLKDDGRCLHEILKDNGFESTYHEEPGVLHAVLIYNKIMEAPNRVLKDGADFFKRHLK